MWQTQINGLYGTLFRRNKEAAFSNYRLWESLGFVIAYAYSTALCARMKLYAVMSVLGFGAFCYIIVEIRQIRKVICKILTTYVSFLKILISPGTSPEGTGKEARRATNAGNANFAEDRRRDRRREG